MTNPLLSPWTGPWGLPPFDEVRAEQFPAAFAAAMRDHLAGLGRWVAERVRVVESPSEVDHVDVVVLAEAVTGSADQARQSLEELAKQLRPGGVVCAATAAVPALFDAIRPALPLTPALDGMRAIVTDGPGVGAAVGALLAWLLVGVAASITAVARRRMLQPLPVPAR